MARLAVTPMIPLWLLVAAATADTSGMPAALQHALSAPAHPKMRWGDISDVHDVLWQSYTTRSWRPLWCKDGHLTQPGQQALAELDSAGARGLDSGDYDVIRLHASADSLAAFDVAAVAEFDVTLSVATARHALALSHGRVDPHLLHPIFNVPPERMDVAVVLEQLTGTARPDTVFRNLEPRHATYQRLVALLAQYRRLASPGITRKADSIPVRIRQIELALERWRWLPHSASAPWIVVNVPAFRLYALGSDREEVGDMLRMNVVAGQAAQHPTPVLATSIIAVQFHPPWLVPRPIAIREIRPLALRDTAFLGRQHYELLRGDTIVAATRANVGQIGTAIDVRQTPGPWNALGRVKFVTPNDADVYLHDTPEQGDFVRSQRDFSHGCIRVAEPVMLTEFVLRGEPDWTRDRIADALSDTAMRVVPLRRPIPVFVVYQTLVPSETGGILVYPDIYGYDKRLDALLRAGYPHRTGPIS